MFISIINTCHAYYYYFSKEYQISSKVHWKSTDVSLQQDSVFCHNHEVLLSGIDSLADIGCFGLTELGYGNNAVEMETTALYDPLTK